MKVTKTQGYPIIYCPSRTFLEMEGGIIDNNYLGNSGEMEQSRADQLYPPLNFSSPISSRYLKGPGHENERRGGSYHLSLGPQYSPCGPSVHWGHWYQRVQKPPWAWRCTRKTSLRCRHTQGRHPGEVLTHVPRHAASRELTQLNSVSHMQY